MNDRGEKGSSFGEESRHVADDQGDVLELFRSRLEAGETVDVDEFVRLHPELEDEFRMIFDWLDLRPVVKEDLSVSSETGDAPRVLGDFKIIRKIGSGGVATVYLAEQISMKRKVALKVLSSYLSFSKQAIEKFRREAEAGGRQVHAGIVSVYAVGEHEGTHYIAQELVEQGVSLADRLDTLRREGGMPIGYFRDAAELFARTADALQFAHNSGVIHRDVKPSNILLTRDGLPKVCDFGLATIEDSLAPSRSSELAGSPDYMSPEQLSRREKVIDQRSDVFSLGVAFFETLTLARPFGASSARQVMQKVLFHDPGDARKANPRVPRDLAVICQKTLEKDQSRRYQTMAELSADLRRFLSGEPITARPAGVARRTMSWMSRHKLTTLALCALMAALLTVAYLSHIVSRQKELKRQFIQRQYKVVKEARGWPDLSGWDKAWQWSLMADPGDPGGFLLAAVFFTERGRTEEAIRRLEVCIEMCADRGEDLLEGEAHFLLGALKLSRADDLGRVDGGNRSSDEQAVLIEAARVAMRRAGEFAPSSLETIFWRDLDPSSASPEQARAFLRQLRLNSHHYLIRLDHGVSSFTQLYKGGRRQAFEDAIEQLEKVLESRPDNIAALTFLGRVYFFYARFYGYFDLLDRAQILLKHAARQTADQPYHLIETTLGQIRLLIGDRTGALDHFERAIEIAAPDKNQPAWTVLGSHNALCGLGDVFSRQGRYEEAILEYEKALERAPADIHVRVNLARLCLHRGLLDEALEYALEAMTLYLVLPDGTEVSTETHFAPAYLLCARAHLESAEYSEFEKYLWEMIADTIDSPRTWSLACFLVATFPEEIFESDAGRETLTSFARRLAAKAGLAASDSALSLSAQGVSSLLDREYADAIAYFEKAAAARDGWPEAVRRCFWHYDTGDDYFLAMSYARLARDKGRDLAAEKKARTFFDRAEKTYLASELPFAEADIIRRIRLKARETIGEPD